MRLLPLPLSPRLALAGCGGSPPQARPVTVDIASFKYKPETVTVKAGGKVTWVNQDKAGHTATFAVPGRASRPEPASSRSGEAPRT